MFCFDDKIESNKHRIVELMKYNHTKRSNLLKLAEKNINAYVPHNMMEIWEEWITNPMNEQNYKYKIYIPLHIDLEPQLIPVQQEKFNLPKYYELYNYSSDDSSEYIDIYDTLILDNHRDDLIKYNLESQYKENIQHGILTLMKEIMEDLIDNYDTLWLDVDGYALKYICKIKYNYKKNKIYGNFTGIITTIKLCTLQEYNNIHLEDEYIKSSKCIIL